MQGEPLDPESELFAPPIETRPETRVAPTTQRKSSPRRRHRQSYADAYDDANQGIVPPDEDIRKLHEECQIARSNAAVLIETLGMDGAEGGLVAEFSMKVNLSQDFLVAQIPWATAQADRSRGKLNEEAATARAQGREFKQVTETKEESLVAALLDANERLVEASSMLEGIRKTQEEEEEEARVTERSKVEVRVDRTVSGWSIASSDW